MDCSPPDSSVHGILQARILEWVAISFSRGISWPKDRTQISCIQFSSVQLLGHVQFVAIPWIAACQASLSITNSWNLLKFMSIELVMPSNHLILCHPLLLLPSIFPSIRVFSIESVLHIKWPKYWSFSFSISPFNEYSDWFPLGLTDLICLLSKGLFRVFTTTVQKHQFFSAQLSLSSNSVHDYWKNHHFMVPSLHVK